ncbi:MAG: cytochrome c biogenesis protein CcdA [Candidatus Sericytochromatia bacterium]|nr:cytochrome c biogenesis protein CcdA [Candidatus Sericytochromatia bacterium]
MSQVNVAVAFGAGLMSFLSPCVLPLVPGYLSFVAGVSLDELKAGAATASGARGRVLSQTLAFVLGFSLVFVLLGASATTLGALLLDHQVLIGRLAGAVVILFGLHTAGWLRIPFLYQERRASVKNRPAGFVGAFVVGLAFAFGWTPCIGPILASILTLASQEETLGQGVALLGAYSCGLALPFLGAALAFDRLLGLFDRVKRHMRVVEVVSGLLLVFVGILLATGGLTVLGGMMQRLPLLNRLSL